MSVCQVCPQGCDTLDKSPNGTCPKYWQRPDGSPLCSQAWTCVEYSATNQRITGAFFLFTTLIYFRIMYFANSKNSQLRHNVSSSESQGHRKDAGCIDRALLWMKSISATNMARWHCCGSWLTFDLMLQRACLCSQSPRPLSLSNPFPLLIPSPPFLFQSVHGHRHSPTRV